MPHIWFKRTYKQTCGPKRKCREPVEVFTLQRGERVGTKRLYEESARRYLDEITKSLTNKNVVYDITLPGAGNTTRYWMKQFMKH